MIEKIKIKIKPQTLKLTDQIQKQEEGRRKYETSPKRD